MSNPETLWTEEDVLNEFIRSVLTDITRTASQWTDVIREAAHDENPHPLRDRLTELQMGVIVNVFSYIDGTRGPTHWPGIELVNAVTHRPLSDDLCWELSRMESAGIDHDGSSLTSDAARE